MEIAKLYLGIGSCEKLINKSCSNSTEAAQSFVESCWACVRKEGGVGDGFPANVNLHICTYMKLIVREMKAFAHVRVKNC